MDCRTGQVMMAMEALSRIEANPNDRPYYKSVPQQALREKTGRNEPCPCGSGVKFKKCCYMQEAPK